VSAALVWTEEAVLIHITYTLHTLHDVDHREDPQAQHVPRVGDLITFDFHASYEVVDVLWHLDSTGGSDQMVTVTAWEHDWHARIKEIETAHQQRLTHPEGS
jgi:hypothetical protein